jgi:hypothetical protein
MNGVPTPQRLNGCNSPPQPLLSISVELACWALRRVRKASEMAPMKLYGMPLSPNVVRVAAALNEKGLDFEIDPVDLRTGAHKQPEFLALNVRILLAFWLLGTNPPVPI